MQASTMLKTFLCSRQMYSSIFDIALHQELVEESFTVFSDGVYRGRGVASFVSFMVQCGMVIETTLLVATCEWKFIPDRNS